MRDPSIDIRNPENLPEPIPMQWACAIPIDDEWVTSREDIDMVFDFPLQKPVRLSFHHPGGFTVLSFYDAVSKGYKQILKHPEDFGYIGGRRQGLVLEGFEKVAPGEFRLHIGS